MNDPAVEPEIPGYDFGTSNSAVSPLSEDDLSLLEQTVGWSESDSAVLHKYADLFRRKAEQMVDTWRSVIGEQPQLAKWFFGLDGKADEEYKARVKRGFVQWVIDVPLRKHDRDWLNYQEEIGLRHTPAKKNVTDGKQTPPLVPLRYLLGFIPVILPIRKFFANSIQNESELSSLEEAWTKGRAPPRHIVVSPLCLIWSLVVPLGCVKLLCLACGEFAAMNAPPRRAMSEERFPGLQREILLEAMLPADNPPLKTVQGARIRFVPGQPTGLHQHAMSTVGVVMEGSFNFQLEGEQARVLRTGDCFFEPAGRTILQFDNASACEPAEIICFYLSDLEERSPIDMLPGGMDAQLGRTSS